MQPQFLNIKKGYLADNLTSLLKVHKLNENALSSKINIPSMTIRRIASGQTSDPHISTLIKIAEHFGVTLDSLVDPKTTPCHDKVLNKPCLVPILSWSDLTDDQWKLSTQQSWHPITINDYISVSDDAFALESKPSMSPRFSPKTVFVIDPHIKPIDSDLVLAKIDGQPTLRELIIDAPKWQLRPIIPGSDTIFFSADEHDIIGTVLLAQQYTHHVKK